MNVIQMSTTPAHAVLVSLENVVTDITELKKGMELTRREYEARKDRPNVPEVLQVFIGNASDKLSKLIADAKVAQEAYSQVTLSLSLYLPISLNLSLTQSLTYLLNNLLAHICILAVPDTIIIDFLPSYILSQDINNFVNVM